MQKLRDEEKRVFDEMMSKFDVLETSYRAELQKLQDHEIRLLEMEKEHQRDAKDIKKLKSELESDVQAQKTLLSGLKSREKGILVRESDISENEAALAERHDAMVEEAAQVQADKQEIDKQKKWIDIQTRQLKYKEYKLKAIAEDEKIQKKLKELE